jgi:hypothetical protein
VAQIVAVEGTVTLLDSPGADPHPAQVGDWLGLLSALSTGQDGVAVLSLDDGSAVIVNPNSSFDLPRVGAVPDNPLVRMFLYLGEVFVFHIVEEELLPGAAIEIDTPNGLMSVRGSAMGVRFGPWAAAAQPAPLARRMALTPTPMPRFTTLVCLAGECTAANPAGQTTALEPGQRVVVGPEGAIGQIEPLNQEDTRQAAEALQAAQAAGLLQDVPPQDVIPAAEPSPTPQPQPTATRRPTVTPLPPTATLPAATLHIRAWIDGTSALIIQGDAVTWRHLGAIAPGRDGNPGIDHPTFLNGAAWYPVWPDVPDRLNRDCDCDSSIYTGIPALAPVAQIVEFVYIQARNNVVITEQPGSGNGYRLAIIFDDGAPGGADWYAIGLNYTVGGS